MKKQKMVPALRFPGFGGEWVACKLGQVADVKRGAASQHLTYVNSDDEGIRLLRINDFLSDAPVYVLKTKDIERFKVSTNDLLIAGTGATAGIVFIIPEEYNGLAYSYNAPRIRVSGANYAFVYFYLKSEIILRQQKSLFVGNAQTFLDTGAMRGFKLSLPTLPEQQKIAQFLTAIDTRIQHLSRKKALLEQYKKGVMQGIFSRQLRFRDEQGREFPEWEVKRLGEVGNTYNGLTGKTKESFGSGYPYINYKQIFDSSRIDISKSDFVEIGNNENQSLVKYGDIFFTTSSETPNEVGYASVLLDKVEILYLNSFCFGFRPNSFDSLDPHFAQFLFRSPDFRRNIRKLAQGSTRYNMSKTQLMKTKVHIPCKAEQQKIAQFLTAIDTQISHVAEQLTQTQTYKRGLLQQMFV